MPEGKERSAPPAAASRLSGDEQGEDVAAVKGTMLKVPFPVTDLSTTQRFAFSCGVCTCRNEQPVSLRTNISASFKKTRCVLLFLCFVLEQLLTISVLLLH